MNINLFIINDTYPLNYIIRYVCLETSDLGRKHGFYFESFKYCRSGGVGNLRWWNRTTTAGRARKDACE